MMPFEQISRSGGISSWWRKHKPEPVAPMNPAELAQTIQKSIVDTQNTEISRLLKQAETTSNFRSLKEVKNNGSDKKTNKNNNIFFLPLILLGLWWVN